MDTTGHNVLITGGSDGIGFALAEAFHERGNHVAICARRTERLAAAATKLQGLRTFRCDVTRDDDLERMVASTVETLGGLSIVVNNAGVQFQDRYGDTPPSDIIEHVNVEVGTNLGAVIKLTALCLPHLGRAEHAGVVNVSSVLALAPKQSAPVYCATKAAVSFFSKALRYQLEDRLPHIRVFDVLPSRVQTSMTEGHGDRGGLKPSRVAKDILAAMERDKYDVPIGHTKSFGTVRRFSPALADRLVRRR